MANQYSRLTAENIHTKLNRRRNPVRSMTALAREFGVNTEYTRANGKRGSAAPGAFRRKVQTLVGDRTYRQITS